MRKVFALIVCFFSLLFGYFYYTSTANETNLKKNLPSYSVTHRSWLPSSNETKKTVISESQIQNIFKENCTNYYSADWEKRTLFLNNDEVSFNAYKTARTREFIEKTANPYPKSKTPIKLRSYKVR